MNPRFDSLKVAAARKTVLSNGSNGGHDDYVNNFGSHLFGRSIMEKMLPQDVFNNVIDAMDGRDNIKSEYSDAIAYAMKEWATNLGATHYSHWFQPLTGAPAEKHDAFIDWHTNDSVIEEFSGKQLSQGEPDASSFPSGGLRSTYEARGYTGWDASSPPFLWDSGDGLTLCIPCVFFSWAGDVLDYKIPLLRSEQMLNEVMLRLTSLCGTKAGQVYSTVGWEQEYFVIDRALRAARSDLMVLDKTVIGAPPPKGQELSDHYFGAVKDRILAYMRDFEEQAIKLGIPVKTRHNEVAPAQHEIASIYEKASISVDHNILIMELMRNIANRHDLACILHEKPFAGINGSGKHTNWSLATDSGINLLDPTDYPEDSLQFIILMTAILKAVHNNSDLLSFSASSYGNDSRLGGDEAPPSIMSVYLGGALESLLDNIEKNGCHHSNNKDKYDFGLKVVGEMFKDNTDRNRTSPFAFTGNKFEFRAVGSTANISLPVMIINTIVAKSVKAMLDEITIGMPVEGYSREELVEHAMPVIRRCLKESRDIRFSGDNYSLAWEEEAKKRGLSSFKNALEAYTVLLQEKSIETFEGILTEQEVTSRYDILCDKYYKLSSIEAVLILDIVETEILPVVVEYQKDLATSLGLTRQLGLEIALDGQEALLCDVSALAETIIVLCKSLHYKHDKFKASADKESDCIELLSGIKELRATVDKAEKVVDDKLWRFPKYRELLFYV